MFKLRDRHFATKIYYAIHHCTFLAEWHKQEINRSWQDVIYNHGRYPSASRCNLLIMSFVIAVSIFPQTSLCRLLSLLFHANISLCNFGHTHHHASVLENHGLCIENYFNNTLAQHVLVPSVLLNNIWRQFIPIILISVDARQLSMYILYVISWHFRQMETNRNLRRFGIILYIPYLICTLDRHQTIIIHTPNYHIEAEIK